MTGEPARCAIAGLTPREVLTPESPEQLAQELVRAHREGLAVIPWGGGTQQALGNAPERLDLVLQTRGLDRILAHSPEDLTVSVEAGMSLSALQAVLGRHSQQVRIDAPFPDRATIGGILAAGGGGPRRLAYGNPREHVIGIRVAHPEGTLTRGGGRVVKNVTGYEMTRLYTGSLGTLGVIVEASFKLAPLPAVTRTLVASCRSPEQVSRLMVRLAPAHLDPLALDTLNGTAAQGIPGCPQGEWIAALEFGGSGAAVDRQLREARALMADEGFESVDEADGAGFWPRVRDFGRAEPDPRLMLRAVVLPSALPHLISAVAADPPPAVIARGSGACYLSWSPEQVRQREPALWAGAVADLGAVAASLGGSLVVEECPTPLTGNLDVWGPPPSGFEVMRRLKGQFDPGRVLNPGRFVGGL